MVDEPVPVTVDTNFASVALPSSRLTPLNEAEPIAEASWFCSAVISVPIASLSVPDCEAETRSFWILVRMLVIDESAELAVERTEAPRFSESVTADRLLVCVCICVEIE